MIRTSFGKFLHDFQRVPHSGLELAYYGACLAHGYERGGERTEIGVVLPQGVPQGLASEVNKRGVRQQQLQLQNKTIQRLHI